MESKTIVSLGIVAVLIAAAVCGAVFVFSGDDDAEYTVKYNANGGTYEDGSQQAESGGAYLAPVINPEPTRPGYVFAGWYDDAQLSNAVTEITQGTYGNITLYAKWAEGFTVEYVLNGGTNHASNPVSYYAGDEITLFPATKSGCLFYGWYDNPSFEGDRIVKIGDGIQKDLTLYAKWSECVPKIGDVFGGALNYYHTFDENTQVVSNDGFFNTVIGYRGGEYCLEYAKLNNFAQWLLFNSASDLYNPEFTECYAPGNWPPLMAELKGVPITGPYEETEVTFNGYQMPAKKYTVENNGQEYVVKILDSVGLMVYVCFSYGAVTDDEYNTPYTTTVEISMEGFVEAPETPKEFGVFYTSAETNQSVARNPSSTYATPGELEISYEGYEFKGWKVEGETKDFLYLPGERITAETKMTAVWEPTALSV